MGRDVKISSLKYILLFHLRSEESPGHAQGLNALIYAEKTMFSLPLPIFQLWMISWLCGFGVMEMF